ncbi:MAG: ribosomal protein S18-alanine N-acetyltransferase [Actinomycetales bacterium]|nr:ribosomal protein S18-alanine N-acetyltransferase [Actinomycetales bacterium]
MGPVRIGQVRIRPMRWWDIDAVCALEAVLFPVDRWSAEQFWSELAQPTRWFLVAERSGDAGPRIIGYAGLFVLGADADVQTIAVAADAQGGGIGRTLMHRLIDLARERGAVQLMLEVRSDNEGAIGLYERLGFERISTRRDYYAPGVDAYVMRLRPLPTEALHPVPSDNDA